jgi:glycosyltransferase involved in cell wall biosynthesis
VIANPGGGAPIAFSVVIPLYNKGPHIARAINSVFAQDHPVGEILVVDDGSSDGGDRLVEAMNDPRIRLFRRDRPGPGGYAARNLGIEQARQPWIAFLDADDAWTPDHLSVTAAAIQAAIAAGRGAPACVATGHRHVFPGGKEELDIYARHRGGDGSLEHLDFAAFLKLWLRLQGAPVWTSATTCRRDALIAAGLFPADRCRRGGDKDMWLRIAQQGVTTLDPRVTAVYYKDSVNMVTAKDSSNTRHCLCETIERLLPGSAAPIGALLQKIYNLEVYKYCLRTVKTARLRLETWRGFFFGVSPVQGLVLLGLSLPLAVTLVRIVFRSRIQGGGNSD